MSFFKQSAVAVAAWNISSVISWFQVSFMKVTMPETYNFTMDLLGAVTVPAWQFTCQIAGVVWEFLNSS